MKILIKRGEDTPFPVAMGSSAGDWFLHAICSACEKGLLRSTVSAGQKRVDCSLCDYGITIALSDHPNVSLSSDPREVAEWFSRWTTYNLGEIDITIEW